MEDFRICKTKNDNVESHLFLDFHGNLVTDKINLKDTMRGQFKISAVDNKRVGKIESYGDKKLYFIKTIKFSPSGEILPNPLDITVGAAYGDTDSRATIYEYTRVQEETFLLYSKFLYTRNSAYFNSVKRRLCNGEA